MLFWKLIEINEKFAAYAKESGLILTVLAAIVYYIMQNKGNSSEIQTCFICFVYIYSSL
jgi:hypothetical protein